MILCVGTTPTVQRSMIFRKLEINEVNRAVEVRDYASGKSPNVARVLKSLGASPVEMGFAGGDRGRLLVADLERAGIDCDFVTVAAPTRLCTTVIDQATGTATELVEESSPIEEAGWRELDRRIESHLPKAQICVFSGSLPPKAPQDFYARWVQEAGRKGIRVILDARGEPLRLAIANPNCIAKLNRQELAMTLDRPFASERAFRDAVGELAGRCAGAIITMGSHGALACDGSQFWKVTPPQVKAISAVGSGDAFAAGLAFELARGRTLFEGLPMAAACGAANAMTALAGHIETSEIEGLLNKVRVERI